MGETKKLVKKEITEAMFDGGPEYDYRCGSCGNGYYADVGDWGCPHCGSCGGSYGKSISDEQYAISMVEYAIEMGGDVMSLNDGTIPDSQFRKYAEEELNKRINHLERLKSLL